MSESYKITGPLSRVFQKTTTSYKFLFFKSILDILNLTGERNEKTNSVSMEEFYLLFLTNAWYPISTFHLSFGNLDQVPIIIDDLKARGVKEFDRNEIEFDELRKEIILCSQEDRTGIQEVSDILNRYVKYRFLTPWMEDSLKGIPDSGRNKKIKQLLEEDYKSEKKYPYHLVEKNGREYLEINSWFETYLSDHFPIVYDWWRWNFAEYLAKKNPVVPFLIHKLESPKQRDLNLARAFWNNILKKSKVEIHCIYSNNIIYDFSLDHFIPWSYVGHDKLWNLVPTLKSVNSQKSDSLPDIGIYWKKFLEMQEIAIKHWVGKNNIRNMKYIKNKRIWDEFQLNSKDNLIELYLQDKNKFRDSLQEEIFALHKNAQKQGFSNWKFFK